MPLPVAIGAVDIGKSGAFELAGNKLRVLDRRHRISAGSDAVGQHRNPVRLVGDEHAAA